jgi:hypothetical protein
MEKQQMYGGHDFTLTGHNLLEKLNFFPRPAEKFILDSNYDSVNGNKAHLAATFNPPIIIEQHRMHYIQMSFLRVPITVPNISAALGNNVFYYQSRSKTDPFPIVDTYTLTMPDGVYSVELINAFIQSQLEQEGHADPHADPPWTALELYANNATGNAVMVINETASLTFEVQFDYNGSLLYQTLGMPQGIITETVVGPNYIDIYGDNSTFFVRCNLVRSLRGPDEDDVLFLSDWVGETWGTQSHSEQFIHPLATRYYKEIDRIEVRITNGKNQLMNFLGDTKDSNIMINLYLVS